jgi:hypothetical protein
MTQAKILWVDGDYQAISSDLTSFNCLLGKHGSKFHANVQTAYDVGIPCGLFFETNPDEMSANVQLDPGSWAVTDVPDYGRIVADIQSNGVNRAINFIMLDISKGSAGKIDADWITGYNGWLMDKVYKKTKLPVYIYLTNNFIAKYTGNDLINIQTFLVNKAETISTSNFTGTLVLPYDDSNNCPWFIWLNNLLSADIIGGVFNGTKEKLYGVLGYVAPVVDETPDDETPGTTPGTTTGLDAETKAAILTIRDIMQKLGTILSRLVGE